MLSYPPPNGPTCAVTGTNASRAQHFAGTRSLEASSEADDKEGFPLLASELKATRKGRTCFHWR